MSKEGTHLGPFSGKAVATGWAEQMLSNVDVTLIGCDKGMDPRNPPLSAQEWRLYLIDTRTITSASTAAAVTPSAAAASATPSTAAATTAATPSASTAATAAATAAATTTVASESVVTTVAGLKADPKSDLLGMTFITCGGSSAATQALVLLWKKSTMNGRDLQIRINESKRTVFGFV